jgi:hypothetical protein
MPSVCAWCKCLLSDAEVDLGLVSHGICQSCRLDVEYRRQPLNSFLNALPAAVMAVDGDGAVVDGNHKLLEMVGRAGCDVLNRLGGEVISCVYADLPGGCGRTVHCIGCTIRGAVNETRASGEARSGVPAFAYTRMPDGQVVKLQMEISTEPVGDLVLLRVDQVTPGPADVEVP